MSHRTKLIDRLYIGSAPASCLGFDVVVLCAEEYQPNSADFLPAAVVRIPLEDSEAPMCVALLQVLDRCARLLAKRWESGDSILVTCQMGRNRSALVSALVLHHITGVETPLCARFVRATRTDATGVPALQNEYFWSLLVR